MLLFLFALLLAVVVAQDSTQAPTETLTPPKTGFSWGSTVVTGIIVALCLVIIIFVMIALIRGRKNQPASVCKTIY